MYDEIEGVEKKEFLNSFVEQVDIYEQEQPDGKFLKHIKFHFPVYFGDRETQELCWVNESTVEIFVFVKILAIIIPENGAKVSKIKCFQFAQQTLYSLLARKRTREVFRAGGQEKPLALFFSIGS